MTNAQKATGENGGAVYSALLRQIKADIVEGRISPGTLLPGENEIAKTHGISRWAVREMLARLADENLVRKVAGKGTIVSDLGVKKPRRAAIAIDLIIDNTDKNEANEYAWGCLEQIRTAAQSMRRPFNLSYRLVDFVGREAEDLGSICSVEADVTVIIPFSRLCRDFLEMYQNTGRHVIVFAAELTNKRIPQVFVDDVEGVRKGVGYLLDIGHRRIAMIAPTEYCYRNGYSLIRQQAFVAQMRQAGCEWTTQMTERVEWAYLPIRESVSRWLNRQDPPTAIFVGDGNWLSPIKAALDLLGKRVPDDITLLSYDDVLDSRVMDPPVTVLRQSIDVAAKCLCQTILDHFEDQPQAKEQYRIPPELIVRESSRPPRPPAKQG